MPNGQAPPPCTCSPVSSAIQAQIDSFYQNLPAGELAGGLSVGIINGVDSSGNPIITKCYSGYANVAEQTLIDEDTVFEIGSTTKTFTTTMLAAAVFNAQTVDLNTSAQTYYDQCGHPVTLPVHIDRKTGHKHHIKMLDLADFTSGIPDKSPTNKTTPYEYSFSDMYDYLNNLGHLAKKPGKHYKYVNTNFGIIADLLMRINPFSTYGDALTSLISAADLQMPNTGVIDSNAPSIPNLAQGYQYDGTIETNYALPTWPALSGAGGIYSTIDDMLQWLQFNMGLTGSSSYTGLLQSLHEIWFPFPTGHKRGTGLGWFVKHVKINLEFEEVHVKMVYKNGGTSGFHAWIGFFPGSQIGAVLLCNSALSGSLKINKHGSPVDNLGEAILKALRDPLS